MNFFLNWLQDEKTTDESSLSDDLFYDIWPRSLRAQTPPSPPPNEFIFALNERLDDPIKQLVLKYFNTPEANKRQLPNADSVVADANGLQILIVRDCFGIFWPMLLKI